MTRNRTLFKYWVTLSGWASKCATRDCKASHVTTTVLHRHIERPKEFTRLQEFSLLRFYLVFAESLLKQDKKNDYIRGQIMTFINCACGRHSRYTQNVYANSTRILLRRGGQTVHNVDEQPTLLGGQPTRNVIHRQRRRRGTHYNLLNKIINEPKASEQRQQQVDVRADNYTEWRAI